MVSGSDIWRAVALLIDQHGDNALTLAARWADEMSAMGDQEGQAVWLCILAAAKMLMSTEPSGPAH